MRKVNDFTLVNVRVSDALYQHMQENASFVAKHMFEGQAIVLFAHNVEHIYSKLKHSYDNIANPALERSLYKLMLESSELYSLVKNGKYEFVHLMADNEQPIYKAPFERMGIKM